MSGVQVKSYLFPEQAKATMANVTEVEEIRRFNLSLDSSKPGLYQTMIEKIQQAYGALLPHKEEIRTYWQDDEGELIGFTSDSELQYAIDVVTALKVGTPYEKNLLFKVYVARKASPGGSQSQEGKCKRDAPQVHFGVVCDGCDGPVVGSRHKCTVCPDYDLCEECQGKGVHGEHPMRQITKPIGCGRDGNYPSLGCGFGQRGPRHAKCGKPNPEKRCNRNGPFQQFMREFGSFPQFAASSVPFTSEAQLKSFGENLRKILDPLGIDVSYYVDGMINAGLERPKQTSASPAEETKQAEAKKTAAASENTTTTDTSVTEKTIRRSESMVEDVEPVVTPKQASSILIEPVQMSQIETGELIDLSKSVNSQAPYESAINALKDVAASYESAAVPSAPAADKIDSMMVDDFNLVDIENELKIIKTIETLKTMGYSDDGGWLTRLVSAKGGNINKVLDAISPNQNRSQ